MPQQKRRCQLEWNPGRWPYVQRCSNNAEWRGTKPYTTEMIEVCKSHLVHLDPFKPVMPV